MPRCEICNRAKLKGHKISITRSKVSRRTNRFWKPNVQKLTIRENGTTKKINICTRCMRTRRKMLKAAE